MSESTKTKTLQRTDEAINEIAQQGAAYGKNMLERSRAVAEETGQSLQKTYSQVAKGAADFNGQCVQMILTNTNSHLDFACQLMSVKSPSAFFELSAAHTRKQFETLAEQAQQLTVLAQKITTDAVEPLRAGVKSAVNKPAA